MTNGVKRSPLALVILAMLYEEPMHPYRMQVLIRRRAKENVINVRQRASLYQTIERLERGGLLKARSATQKDNRPERTVYELTDTGRETMLTWMREILSTPAAEFPEFPAALSVLALLKPADARRQLEQRAAARRAEIDNIDQQLKLAAHVPRLFLIEVELERTLALAELHWLESVIDDLKFKRLTWSVAWLRKMAVELGATGKEKE